MNAVSIREAIGSAANARAAGNAMRSISKPRSSNLKTLLKMSRVKIYHLQNKLVPSNQLLVFAFHDYKVKDPIFKKSKDFKGSLKVYLASSKKTKSGYFHFLSGVARELFSAITIAQIWC